MHIRELRYRRVGEIRIVGAAMLLLCLQACIIVPVPQFASDHVTQIGEEQLAGIEPGKTSRDEIREAYGEPGYSFGNGARWLYEAKSHRAGGVRWCGGAAIPLPNGDGDLDEDDFIGGGGCSDKRDDRVVTYLDIEFSNSDVVTNYSLQKAHDGKCEHGMVCTDNQSRLTMFAEADQDARARSSDAKPGQCVLFVYSMTDKGSLDFWFTGDQSTHRIHARDGFLRFDVDEGPRRLDYARLRRIEQNSGSVEFDCSYGSRHYMRQEFSRKTGFEFTPVSSTQGEAEIARLKLQLPRDPGTQL